MTMPLIAWATFSPVVTLTLGLGVRQWKSNQLPLLSDESNSEGMVGVVRAGCPFIHGDAHVFALEHVGDVSGQAFLYTFQESNQHTTPRDFGLKPTYVDHATEVGVLHQPDSRTYCAWFTGSGETKPS